MVQPNKIARAIILYACLAAGLSAALAIVGGGSAQAMPAIRWRVENPFRFFTDPADSEVHRATYRALSPDEKRNPVLASEQALQGRIEGGWAESIFNKTCWNANTNRHTCKAYDDYVNPQSHTIIAEIYGLDESKGLTCTWLTALPRTTA